MRCDSIDIEGLRLINRFGINVIQMRSARVRFTVVVFNATFNNISAIFFVWMERIQKA
jgi:hypothetical protein